MYIDRGQIHRSGGVILVRKCNSYARYIFGLSADMTAHRILLGLDTWEHIVLRLHIGSSNHPWISVHLLVTPSKPSNQSVSRSLLSTMSGQRLQSRVAIVTGSSQGIGREICNQFFLEGALLVCADLRPLGQGEDIATNEWIAQKGGKAIFVEVDVSNADSWKTLVAKTVETYGRLDM